MCVMLITVFLHPLPNSCVDRAATSEGKLTELSQAGWNISYEKYSSIKGIELPARSVLVAPEGQATLKVLLRDWTLE